MAAPLMPAWVQGVNPLFADLRELSAQRATDRWGKNLMRVAQILWCPLFLWFAYLQLNDPDAVIWAVAYCAVSLNCACAAFNKTSTAASLVLTAALVTWAAVIAMTDSSHFSAVEQGSFLDNEVVREVAGLMLGSLWSAITAIHAIQRPWKEKA